MIANSGDFMSRVFYTRVKVSRGTQCGDIKSEIFLQCKCHIIKFLNLHLIFARIIDMKTVYKILVLVACFGALTSHVRV